MQSQIKGLKLDELELGSLRGEVEEATLRLDLEARHGRGQVAVRGPRFSGLQGESLNTALRWEKDVVRLERANLQQKNSRWLPSSSCLHPSTHVLLQLPLCSQLLIHVKGPAEMAAGQWLDGFPILRPSDGNCESARILAYQ